jgi:hypothetical protein
MGHPTSSLRRPILACVLCALVGSVVSIAAAAPPSASREYEVKAAALYNIIAFTEWPESAFASADAPLMIAVFGRGPIAGVIADLIPKESWHGRKLALRSNPPVADATTCHVVFVSRTEQTRWDFMRGQFAGRPILTVGDGDDFAAQGGAVQLSIERGKLHLTVNLAAARAARLQISPKVLALAEVIGANAE